MAIITLVFGRDILGSYEIDKEKMIVGRSDDCDIAIDNLAVSRHHAILEKKEGTFTISDLDSNNGTFVNGQLINGATMLNFGDEIGIGKHVLVFDSHARKAKSLQHLPPAGARPDMDSAERGTMFVEPETMEKIQKKVTAARKAHLVPKGDPNAKPFQLEKSDIVFGKSPDSDIVIKGFFAARRHAILSHLDKGFQLTNLAVLSPARVNGIRIESAILLDGDEITMGKNAFIFHSEQ
jgi:pSer/pThr/pTyr-binding forkhead associated (FHA) protein